MERLIRAEQLEAEADRRAEERAAREAQRRVKRETPLAGSAAAPPPAAAADEASPARPEGDRPIRRRSSDYEAWLDERNLARTTPYRRSVEAGDFSTAELELRDATAARLAAASAAGLLPAARA